MSSPCLSYLADEDSVRECNCQNCGTMTLEKDLRPIRDLEQRIAPGEIVPAGECPECGCLASLFVEPQWLEGENRACAAVARQRGWRIDADHFWTRPLREGDIDITDGNAHFGFTVTVTDDCSDLPAGPSVFVRCAAYALAYDHGKITPYEPS